MDAFVMSPEDPDKPWVATDEDITEMVRRADAFFAREKPENLRLLYDRAAREYTDPLEDALTNLALLAFVQAVRRNPSIKVEST